LADIFEHVRVVEQADILNHPAAPAPLLGCPPLKASSAAAISFAFG
jgi:hypothetical protein